MNDPFQLVTNCNFKGKDYLVQMCVLNSKKLELIVTDKIMAEDWQCEYDASYIEALTHKTGNFKQFDVFVMMLKSGLLKTSESISLDLLTVDDLEQLRNKKILNSQSSTSRTNQSLHLNKRYLILTYSVEFDRIHYPLPLDYCGPPDPTVLQNNIRRLETEIERLRHKNNALIKDDNGDAKKLKEKLGKTTRMRALLEENKLLTQEIHRLKKSRPLKTNPVLLKSLKNLEEQVIFEKTHNREIIIKLKAENKHLKHEVEELRLKEKALNLKLKDASRCGVRKIFNRFSRNSLSPEIVQEHKRNPALNCLDPHISNHAVVRWNISPMSEYYFLHKQFLVNDHFLTNRNSVQRKQRNSNIVQLAPMPFYRPNDIRSIKRVQNKYLTSSSSESEDKRSHRPRSREKKSFEKRKSISRKGELCRKSSNEKSRHSSHESKRNVQTNKSRCTTASQQEKPGIANFPKTCRSQTVLQSRESSLSSRGSSKQSKQSRFSNHDSGSSFHLKKLMTPRAIEENEDLKFTMSDLEARIHSLQKLITEGIHF